MFFGDYKVFIVSVNNLQLFNCFKSIEFLSWDFQPEKKKCSSSLAYKEWNI
jgi:hypothetical protein